MTVSGGDSGSDVGHAHQRLIELGYAIADEELQGATFGPSTLAAVRAFQIDQQLDPDGIIGIQTAHRLDHPGCMGRHTAPGWRYDRHQVHAELVRVTDAAVGDLGLHEDPDNSNDGPQLAKFKTGKAPWCAFAAFHWYAHHEGGAPWERTSSTVDVYEWARKHGRLVDPADALRPGDLWFKRRAEKADKPERRGHLALTVTVREDSRLCCVGGNEGNRVFGSVRRREDATAIIRPVLL